MMKPIAKLHLRQFDVVKMSLPLTGHITGGYRPYIVVSPDWLNTTSSIITVIPCTTTDQRPDGLARCRTSFGWALAYLPQTLDTADKNLEGYILGTLSPVDSEKLEKARLEA